MLFGFITGASAFLAGFFWRRLAVSLWMMPVLFAGFWLALALAALVFLVAVCAAVDLGKPQTRDSRFYRGVMYVYIEALICLVRVRLHTRGLEQTPAQGRFMLVCNHLFLADPGIVHHCFRRSQLAFITKQENLKMPIINKFLHKTLCQSLDREDNRQALRVIRECIRLIDTDQVSIGVFPEGYTSRDGKLHPFRHGVFRIAQKTGVPIVVCTIRGTRDIFRNLVRGRHTDVALHLVRVIRPEEYAGMTTVELSQWVYELMLADLGEEFRPDANNT